MIDNISQATLDVIEAIKTKQVIKFDYGHDVIREIKPTGFFGDFDGFEGTDESTDDREFRRFRFDKIHKWVGIIDIQERLHELERALSDSKNLTKEAKGLSYPVIDIICKLSRLAEEHDLKDAMEYYTDQVLEVKNELESAFYECESVFQDAIGDLELSLYEE